MRTSTILAAATALAAASSAWPWDKREPAEALRRDAEPELVERQDAATKTSFNLSFSTTPTDTPESSTADPTNTDNTETLPPLTSTGGDSTATNTVGSIETTGGSSGSSGTGTARQTGTATGTNRRTGTQTTNTAVTSYDPRLPAGGVSMITPNAMSPASYYKIADYITFAWNYTSLSATPSYIDILASCSANQATYTISMNQTFQPTQTILWDTGAYQSNATIPLLTEKYTLIIHDAAKDVTAAPAAGYLGTYSQFTFGMYSPQAYTPLSDFVCATCNGVSTLERQTWAVLLGVVGVTVLSFGWFAGVAGVF
nr:hypothetical protein B0A51_07693 [Rachicladosporium sp. CCFEE 5018]